MTTAEKMDVETAEGRRTAAERWLKEHDRGPRSLRIRNEIRRHKHIIWECDCAIARENDDIPPACPEDASVEKPTTRLDTVEANVTRLEQELSTLRKVVEKLSQKPVSKPKASQRA